MKVLYIEDDIHYQRIIEMYMRMAGHSLITADDVRNGLKLAYRELPEIILMDYELPVINGLQAVKILRSNERLKRIPIIAVTGYATDDNCWRFFEGGCNGFVPKPIDKHILIKEIDRVITEMPAIFA